MQKEEQNIFNSLELKVAPKNDEIEIVLLGKGVGECILIHIGDFKYVIIDSFINNLTGKSVALEYLNSIGVNYSNIELIICTHWHKDHIEGINQILETSSDIKFVTYDIVEQEVFQKYIELGSQVEQSSTYEFAKALEYITNNSLCYISAHHNQMLLNKNACDLTHSKTIKLISLSPQHIETLDYIRNLNLPDAKDLNYVFPDKNDISIVVWLEIENDVVLFGADMENNSNPNKGWNAIITNHSISSNKANIYKVAHHGSNTGHNQNIWTNLLNPYPISIMSAYNRSKLPTNTDKNRLRALSSEVFIAGNRKIVDIDSKDIEKKIRHTTNVKVYKNPDSIGIIRIRKVIGEQIWNKELFGSVEIL